MLMQKQQCLEIVVVWLLLLLPASSVLSFHHNNYNSARKAQQSQRKLEYKTFVGDYDRHSFIFPIDDQNNDIDEKSIPVSSFIDNTNVFGRLSSRKHTTTTTTTTTTSPSSTTRTINNRHSSADWFYNLATIPNSTVLKEVKNPVLALAGWATFISVIYQTLIWCGKSKAASFLAVSHSAHGFLVSSLGMLLVFRTNSAYQRFLEGRRIWEHIHTVIRNFSRTITLYQDEVGTYRVHRIKNLMAAFPYLLRHHVRSGCLCSNKDPKSMDRKYRLTLYEPTSELVDSRYEGDKTSGGVTRINTIDERTIHSKQCFVDRRELPWCLLNGQENALQKVAEATNRPLWLADRLGREIMDIPLSESFSSRERLSLLCNVDKLTQSIGQCERIHQTSVPLNYARHALRGLSLWLFTLPFCLVRDLGLLTGLSTAIIAWLLFGVYQIGHSIEDPFQGSLRLSILCDAIRKDVLTTDSSAFCINDRRSLGNISVNLIQENDLDMMPQRLSRSLRP